MFYYSLRYPAYEMILHKVSCLSLSTIWCPFYRRQWAQKEREASLVSRRKWRGRRVLPRTSSCPVRADPAGWSHLCSSASFGAHPPWAQLPRLSVHAAFLLPSLGTDFFPGPPCPQRNPLSFEGWWLRFSCPLHRCPLLACPCCVWGKWMTQGMVVLTTCLIFTVRAALGNAAQVRRSGHHCPACEVAGLARQRNLG